MSLVRSSLLAAVAACTSTTPERLAMTPDRPTLERANKQLVRDAATAFFGRRDRGAVDRYFAADYIQHNEHAPPGRDGVKRFFDVVFTAFPDLSMEFDHLHAERDLVFGFVTWRGTHRGAYFGAPPSGQRVSWRTAEIFRIADGKIAEHWDVVDASTIFAASAGPR